MTSILIDSMHSKNSVVPYRFHSIKETMEQKCSSENFKLLIDQWDRNYWSKYNFGPVFGLMAVPLQEAMPRF